MNNLSSSNGCPLPCASSLLFAGRTSRRTTSSGLTLAALGLRWRRLAGDRPWSLTVAVYRNAFGLRFLGSRDVQFQHTVAVIRLGLVGVRTRRQGDTSPVHCVAPFTVSSSGFSFFR